MIFTLGVVGPEPRNSNVVNIDLHARRSLFPYKSTARVLSGCCFCCLWCLEKAIKFINKNAFSQTAIFGSSFCKGCIDAFQLLSRNIVRVFALSFVSELIFVLTKVWVVR